MNDWTLKKKTHLKNIYRYLMEVCCDVVECVFFFLRNVFFVKTSVMKNAVISVTLRNLLSYFI